MSFGQYVWRFFSWIFGLILVGLVCIVLVVGMVLVVIYPTLPDVSALKDYHPKLPLRIYSSEGLLLSEFGQERRTLTPLKDIPDVMKNALLSIEDAEFYQHKGIYYKGMGRALLANFKNMGSQGASTITMQTAKNLYLSPEKTVGRKFYELLLTLKLEHELTKDQILEVYMNHIFLGNRSYGFAMACESYFGKSIQNITLAEAAMLAGLPKAPSVYNPIVRPKRARMRQLYILDRMVENHMITPAQAEAAKNERLQIRTADISTKVHSEYVTETVRQLIFAQYGGETYTKGLNVYTTIKAVDQVAAYQAVRKGVMAFENRKAYRGPEAFVDLPNASVGKELEEAVDAALNDHPDNDDLQSAVVLKATPKKVTLMFGTGETLDISGAAGLHRVYGALSDKAIPVLKIRRGAVVRVLETPAGWEITQLPDVESAFVAMEPQTGAIRALIGGFDFNKSKYNHVTQAWRQPGSSFKPFIYSASLEEGLNPSTVIEDGPLFFDGTTTGGQVWEPKNYDGKFEGPMTMRRALAKSKNMVSIRILQKVGVQEAQQWVTKFGFDAERHPAYLTMALGAGSVTPMQMASAYSVFANGGYRVNPYLIAKITDYKGNTISQTNRPPLDESMRVIGANNAFITNSLLQEVTTAGTAAKAKTELGRDDIYGKTGTTNDAIDAWFAGFHPTLTAVVWMGYDNPRPLGSTSAETGGGLSLPIWIDFMQQALKNTPITPLTPPENVIRANGDWAYSQLPEGKNAVRSLGVTREARKTNAENVDAMSDVLASGVFANESGNASPVVSEAASDVVNAAPQPQPVTEVN